MEWHSCIFLHIPAWLYLMYFDVLSESFLPKLLSCMRCQVRLGLAWNSSSVAFFQVMVDGFILDRLKVERWIAQRTHLIPLLWSHPPTYSNLVVMGAWRTSKRMEHHSQIFKGRLYITSAVPASLLFRSFDFPASLLFCFSAFLLLIVLFLQSCGFAALLLPAPLLLCLFAFIFLLLYSLLDSCLYPKRNPGPRETLEETQRHPKDT